MITKIESRKVNPSVSVMTRLLEPLGYTYEANRQARPAALAAARKACDPNWVGAWPEGADEWMERFSQTGWLDTGGAVKPSKKPDVLFHAGLVNRVDTRPGAQRFTTPPGADWFTLVERLAADGIEYALTGGPAANQLMPMGGGFDPIIYVPDVGQAADTLGLEASEHGMTILLPYDGVCEVGAEVRPKGFYADGVRMACRNQIIMDCVALPKAGLAQAESLTGRRN